MRVIFILLVFIGFSASSQITLVHDSTRIAILDATGQPVPNAMVRVNGIHFAPYGNLADGIYSAPMLVLEQLNRFSKCYVEVYHPAYAPYIDSVFAIYPVMLSHHHGDYIYEINKRYVTFFEDLTIISTPNEIELDKLLRETSGTLFTKYDPCEGSFWESNGTMLWVVRHQTKRDQMSFRSKWKSPTFAVITFDPDKQKYQALTREIIIESVSVWKDAEVISVLLNSLKSDGLIESWQSIYSAQYSIILPLGQESNGSTLIEELMKTPYFFSASQLRASVICLD